METMEVLQDVTFSQKLQEEVRAALATASDATIPPAERAEMLMEIAMGLQNQPETPEQLHQAVALYEQALALLPENAGPLLGARIQARQGTALLAIPDVGTGFLERAVTCFEDSSKIMRAAASPDELAEVEMNLGLALQTLAGYGKARLTDAVAAYQRSLRAFNAQKFPKEYAILQNNLATAFLQMPMTGDQKMNIREALAVQAFEQALGVVNLIEYPVEYAMLQNNLGNALQYSSSTHSVENCLRALDAYDEALKVRRPDNMPSAYANTIANKASCLLNVPDNLETPEQGNIKNLRKALDLYQEARDIFIACGEEEKAETIDAMCHEIRHDISEMAAANDDDQQTLHIKDVL